MSEETPENQVSFKVKTSADGNHSITMPDSASVLDLKNKLATAEYENVPADRQRLIYSGRVMKNEEPLSTYKIKAGNTIHMVKSAQSNAAQNPANAGATASPAAGVPQNMAAGTANNPLAGLTGARYAGHVQLPGREMFGADGGMGAPPSNDQMADMLSDPNVQQTMNEALNNPAMIDLMIQSNPMLRNMGPQAREMLQSPMFRQMMTNPDTLRQAARMRSMMGGGGAAGGFPAPGVTDTTPEGAAGTTPNAQANAGAGAGAMPDLASLFGGMPGGAGAAAGNPFASLFGAPPTAPAATTAATSPPPAASAGQNTPRTGAQAGSEAPPNPFASLFGGAGAPGAGTGAGAAGSPFGGLQMTPEMMQQAMQMMRDPAYAEMLGGGGLGNLFGGGAAGGAPAAPADSRPPEERYADQLRQLNDMGFFDFDRNVEALRRSGGSVQGAIEQLLS